MKIGKKDDLFRALSEIQSMDAVRDDEFTREEFESRHNPPLSSGQAQWRLAQLYKAGKLNRRKAIVEGRIANVYSLPSPPDSKSGKKVRLSRH